MLRIIARMAAIAQAAIKPFVDAINTDGDGSLKIQVYFSGTLGKVQKELPQMGTADIAFIIPGQIQNYLPTIRRLSFHDPAQNDVGDALP